MVVRLTPHRDMFDLQTLAEMVPDDGGPAGATELDCRIADMVAINEEGAVVSTDSGGRPPASKSPAKGADDHEPLSPFPLASIELAWTYRHELPER
jgi:hypothetical protein